ncbi:fatty acyl-CoA reductase 1 [Cephus cinctus]|uniref:Fatty acyl-CoA reductase n=1 Tax=Cephus cinctus TaxID=211228 RepID=A0AAJ7FGU7_CEPCN|nr:fatty acyl-CoA reductase 1 [Cephus cinctus]
MLDLANQCKNMNCFAYVSTAYSNCHNMEIEEKFYPAPADLKMVEDMIEADLVTEGLSEASLKMLLDPFPNIYTFTKATAESLVRNYCANAKFAALVFRPSIVISTVREPIPGWSGKLNGPMAGYAATSAGIVHSMWYKGNPIDFVPVDMSVNGILAAIWDTTENRKSNEAVVYNYATSTVQPITLRRLKVIIDPIRDATPTKKMVWACFVFFINNYYVWQFSNIFLHLIPAILVDLILSVQGRKPFVVSSYFKVNKYYNVIYYFWNREWKISVKEMSKTWDQMSPVDRELFYCDLRDLDWSEWSTNFWPGLRVHSLKDPLDTVPAAKIKQRKLKIVNYVLMGILMLLIYYGLQKLLGSFISIFY